MAHAHFARTACWRCERHDVQLFMCDGHLPNGPFPTLCCRVCVETLIEVRRNVEMRGSRRRRRELEERNLLMIDAVTLLRQGAEPTVLHYDTDALDTWLESPELIPPCVLCGAYQGYHVYESHGDVYPLFAACRTCIRHAIQCNTDPSDRRHLFAFVMRPSTDDRHERLRWGTRALVTFLAADYPWAEAMDLGM